MTRPLPLLLLAVACAPTVPEDPAKPPPPPPEACLQVTDTVRFEPSASTEASTLDVVVSNECSEGETASLFISEVGVTDGPFEVSGIPVGELPAGASVTASITYTPTAVGEQTGTLSLRSDDPDSPLTTVELIGQTLGPALQIEGVQDHGRPSIGCSSMRPVRLTNRGTSELLIYGLALDSVPAGAFRLDLDTGNNGEMPFRLEPYQASKGGPAVEVYSTYTALDEAPDSALVTVSSDDLFQRVQTRALQGSGARVDPRRELFIENRANRADILFTLDRSSGLDDDNARLIDASETFVRTLKTDGVDFQIAATVADNGCIVGPEPFIDNSFSATAARDAFEVMADLRFERSSYGSLTERGLMLAEAALSSKNLGPGGCNEGLLRDYASLHVVMTSDEPDRSVESWSYYVSEVQGLKADPEDAIFHAIAGDYPSGCGGAAAGTGYYETTVATGGLFLSFCDTDWDGKATDLAKVIKPRGALFELEGNPVPATQQVTVDGLPVASGWAYDPSFNGVTFDEEHAPAKGAEVVVTYDHVVTCE